MGTLVGTVEAEMALEPSVRSVADVVERHMASGESLCLDWEDYSFGW
ncbi:hypothetical protein ACELLULO517_26305 [Acidisoma cellulosilytica]|uniref:Uncharacterized protein n=1 Tax=Acidisoma cellulosilyticum TaxID=2802395 RepID=A0A964E7A0_9PROT|nr:hypothetical protein [Acidisoma cellulosilyticum]MCB8883788.1 hypothetical protein [Acidisoma cellulosilyticum]